MQMSTNTPSFAAVVLEISDILKKKNLMFFRALHTKTEAGVYSINRTFGHISTISIR